MSAEGYDYRTRATGEVVIFHHGKLVKTLRADEAQEFMREAEAGDAQAAMAGVVGNDGQVEHPGSHAESGGGMRNNGAAHGHTEFRRKSV
ncbi:hypothetical protein [Demequina sp. NBRC 110057]|uniref:hypothetical protein n=1 Tax=Demequina sp. NBRC 110057 TaxID=1570346 RepID=UPI0009FD8ADC|nr:hypothetical protein [Demequina sp. NBRC 110057]